MPEKFYTAAEVAEMIGVDPRSIQRYINKGKFPNAFKTSDAPNSPWRIPEKDVQEYLKLIGKK